MSDLDLLQGLIGLARKAGADAADAILVAGTSLSVSRRLGAMEQLERSEGQDLGLRVFVGKRAAIVSATSVDPAGFASLAERAVAMARVVPEDPFGGLAELAAPPGDAAPLELDDPSEPSAEDLIARAAAAEEAMLAVPGITNSEGASAGFGRTRVALVTSAGFAGAYSRTGHSVSASALAGTGTGMVTDYAYSGAVHLADLDDPALVGRRAAERVLAGLNPTRPKTARLPVVFDRRVSGSVLGHLAGAINGAAIARGTSFLKDSLGQQIFAPGIMIVDDPRRVRGSRSRIFDGEGVPTARRAFVEDGVLTSWVLDSRTGRQLGLASTGHAGRGTGGPPSPGTSNFYLAAGSRTPAELMADIKLGFYVTSFIGSAVNGLTGDYSRGVFGFMIRDGVLAEPAAEVTIAGRLQEMFLALVAADDLEFKRGMDAPTLYVGELTVAGA